MTELTEQQEGAQGWQQATALIVLGAAALVLIGGLFIILMLGANTVEILALARQYLFRSALKNTLIVAAVAVALGSLITLATLWASNGRINPLLRWSLLLPLVMPAVLVALTWRMALISTSAWPQHPLFALLLMGMIAAWRAAPFLILLPLISPRRTIAFWGGTMGIAAYVAVSDVATPLLLTGGQPFNATHTLASWTYQLAAVNGAWGESAAAAIVWIGLLALPVGAILIALHGTGTDQMHTHLNQNRHEPRSLFARIIVLLIALWLLLPIAYLLLSDIGWLHALGPLMRNTGYLQWWLNTLVLAIMVAAVAVPTSAFAGVWSASNHGRWRALIPLGTLGLALLIWPALFVPVGWLVDQRDIHPEWLLWLPLSAVVTCVGVWLSTHALQRGRPKLVMRLGLSAALFVVWHELTLTLIVRQPLVSQAVGPATVSMLGGSATDVNEVLTAAILLTTLMALLMVGMGTRARKRR